VLEYTVQRRGHFPRCGPLRVHGSFGWRASKSHSRK
jgi:hypothetical protein